MKTAFPYILKAILLRLRGTDVPLTGSRISMTVKVEGKGSVRIGRSECRPNVYFACKKGARILLGDNVFINRNSIIICHNEITIGDGSSIGPNVCIFDHDHKYGKNGVIKGFVDGSVRIGKNVWIGAGAIILRDSDIGDNCIIGAGTVVKGHIPDNKMVLSKGGNSITDLQDR